MLSGKSILLLVGGLLIGWMAGPQGIAPLDRLFFDLFKGFLAFFLLEMGLVVAVAWRICAVLAPSSSALPCSCPWSRGCSASSPASGWALRRRTALLATLYASASYIAAPAAMRIAVPRPIRRCRSALHWVSPFLQPVARYPDLPLAGNDDRRRCQMNSFA